MNNYRNEVCSKHARAVAEYRIAVPRAKSDFSQLGYWAIVDTAPSPNRQLGRGDTEESAWEVAALTERFDSMLSELDRHRQELRAD